MVGSSYTDNRNGGLCSVCDICKNVFAIGQVKRLQSTIDTDGNRCGTEGKLCCLFCRIRNIVVRLYHKS